MLPQYTGIRLPPGRFELLECRIAVSRHPLACVKRGAANTANRSGDKVVFEADAIASKTIDIGRFYDRIASASKGVVSPIIRVEDKNV